MHRRGFLKLLPPSGGNAARAKRRAVVEDDLRITGVRLVTMRPKRPVPRYEPTPGSWSTGGVEVANPVSIYRSTSRCAACSALTAKSQKLLGGNRHQQGGQGLRSGRARRGVIVEDHLAKLLMGENPLDIQRLWDIMWRSTMFRTAARASQSMRSPASISLCGTSPARS